MYYKEDFREILQLSVEQFWNHYHIDEKLAKSIEKMFQRLKIAQRAFLITGLMAIVMYYIKPLYNKKNPFILETWVFANSNILDGVVLIVQYYFYYVCVPIVLGYDLFYLAFCVDVAAQITLLGSKLRSLHLMLEVESIKEFIICIRHHLLLLSLVLEIYKYLHAHAVLVYICIIIRRSPHF